jgi:PE family
MSFVIVPEIVAGAAGKLAGIGSMLGEATAAAVSPTTSVAAAAADEVSHALSQLFGTYGQEFQAASAQAAAFHTGFVSLLNGGAAAYLNTEIANAQQGLMAMTAPGGATAASTIFGIPGISLPGGLLGSPGTNSGSTFAYGTAWQTLFANTGSNLQANLSSWAAHPFPVLTQINANQNSYADTVGTGFVTTLQNYQTSLANVPANVQIAVKGVSDAPSVAQAYFAKQAAESQATNAALQNLGMDLQNRVPFFQYDLGMIGSQVMSGDYHGAVQRVPQAFVDLLISGVDISNGTNITIQGPAGDLLPLTSQSGTQDLIDLLQPNSIPQRIAQNFVNVFNTVPSSLGLSLIGPPLSTLDGLATGATEFGAALQTGDPLAVAGALVDLPAHALDGFLNGQPVLDLRIPISASFDLPAIPPLTTPIHVDAANAAIIAHLPFNGLLAQPEQMGATIEIPSLLGPTLVDLPLGNMQFGGLITELLTHTPQQVAAAISPH